MTCVVRAVDHIADPNLKAKHYFTDLETNALHLGIDHLFDKAETDTVTR